MIKFPENFHRNQQIFTILSSTHRDFKCVHEMIPGKMANSNKKNMRMCDESREYVRAMIHTETPTSLYRARGFVAFCSRRTTKKQLFSAIHSNKAR